jgi:hypothetical protein
MLSPTAYNSAIKGVIRDFLDFFIVVNAMPKGFLWSSILVDYQVGFIGSFTSFLLL